MGILGSNLSCVVLLSTFLPASAQWTNTRTPGVPRTPDGKPNLSAPAPKTADGTPDLSGLWEAPNGKYLQNLAADVGQAPFLPWAETYYKRVQENNGKGRPTERCLPHGVPDYDALPMPIKIIQIHGELVILYEAYTHFRQVFLDGRPLPKDPQPTWMGYSVGRWERDTLVVDSSGFNDLTWLDDGGHPHSEALHVTERFHRRDFGHMDLQLTVDDPKAYTKPWGAALTLNFQPDDELMESICENEKDFQHIVGK